MSQIKQKSKIVELAKLVDENYIRPKYVLYIIWVVAFLTIIGIAVSLVGQMILIGLQAGVLDVDSTISSTIALVALVIAISQYGEKSNTIDDNDYVVDSIKKNLDNLSKKNPKLTEEEKLILSGLIKLKVRNEKANVQNAVQHLSQKPEDWIAFLYGLGDGTSLL
jgi:hypothetical protein